MKTHEFSAPGFFYGAGLFPDASCALCHGQGKALLCRRGELLKYAPVGICESCSNLAHGAWRQVAGEASGSPAEVDVSRIYVVVARRRRVSREDAPPGATESERALAAPAELCSSWEFMLAEQPDGSLDLPSASGLSIQGSERVSAAALRSLDDLGLASWPPLIESLYSSYTPRGHLAQVVLARGWTARTQMSERFAWHAWPISAHAGNMAAFWRGMETVWPLRLYKHCAEGVTEELCVRLREAARRFIELQEAVREGREADTTMLAALQAGMSVDEVAIARMIQRAAEKPGDEGPPKHGPLRKGRRSKKEISPEATLDSAPRDEPEDREVSDEIDSPEFAGGGEAEGDEVEGGEDGLDDPTFARPRR